MIFAVITLALVIILLFVLDRVILNIEQNKKLQDEIRRP